MSGPESRPRLLVTGANGQVGWRLRSALSPLGEVVALTREQLDLSDERSVRERVRAVRPSVVVNAAAYTAVDRAEQEAETAYRINAVAPRVLAEEAARTGALLVHYSTDYVFDGSKPEPYTEEDVTAPTNVYGESKRAGEEAVMAVGGRCLVLRTSWVYDVRGHNFLRTMLRLAHEREELRVVDDQIGAPTWARVIAEATSELVHRFLSGRSPLATRQDGGILHLAAAGSTSWHGFASAILQSDPQRREQRCRSLVPIPTREYPTPARRPARSLLSTRRLEERFGLRLPGWPEQLARAVQELKAVAPR